MANLTTRTLRKDNTNIFLIGQTSSKITGSKLPSRGQVLSRLFYEIRENKLKVNESASVVLDEVFEFWKIARIPFRSKNIAVKLLLKLYNQWRDLQKKKSRTSDGKSRDDFVETLEDLFDIATVDALQSITIEEDREFLISQRKRKREGCMLGVDKKLSQKEKRSKERYEAEEKRKKTYLQEKESLGK
jgi:hypothetical protein